MDAAIAHKSRSYYILAYPMNDGGQRYKHLNSIKNCLYNRFFVSTNTGAIDVDI